MPDEKLTTYTVHVTRTLTLPAPRMLDAASEAAAAGLTWTMWHNTLAWLEEDQDVIIKDVTKN